MSRSTLHIIAVFAGIAFLLLVGAVIFIWIEIAGIKGRVVKGLESALGAKVEIASLNIDAWKGQIEATGISFVNQRPEAPWDKGEVGQAIARFKIEDLFSTSIPLSVEVSSWKLTLHSSASDAPNSAEEMIPPTSTVPSPKTIQVTQITAHEGEVEIDLGGAKKVLVHGISFEAKDDGTGKWTTGLKAASVDAGTIQTGAGSVQIQGSSDKLVFSGLHLLCGEGAIDGNGQISLTAEQQTQATFTGTKVPVSTLVAARWQMKVSGLVSGSLEYQGNNQGASAHGHIDVTQAKINVLPILSKVASLVSLPDLASTDLDKATTDIEWKAGVLHLTNLDLRKADVARIAGEVQVDQTGQIDGNLKLGLPSTVTAKWPDLQTKIFSVAFEDYNWTEVHVTGTPDQLQEDLSPRLLAVGANDGGNLLNSAAQKAVDLFNNFVKP